MCRTAILLSPGNSAARLGALRRSGRWHGSAPITPLPLVIENLERIGIFGDLQLVDVNAAEELGLGILVGAPANGSSNEEPLPGREGMRPVPVGRDAVAASRTLASGAVRASREVRLGMTVLARCRWHSRDSLGSIHSGLRRGCARAGRIHSIEEEAPCPGLRAGAEG